MKGLKSLNGLVFGVDAAFHFEIVKDRGCVLGWDSQQAGVLIYQGWATAVSVPYSGTKRVVRHLEKFAVSMTKRSINFSFWIRHRSFVKSSLRD